MTGISIYIQNTILCSKILKLCTKILAEVHTLTTNMQYAVSEVHGKKAEDNGVLKVIDDKIRDISTVE